MDTSRKHPPTTRLYRDGTEPRVDTEWLNATPAQRIEAVWTLTEQCLQWQGSAPGEPRLQRSVSRVQRTRR